MMRTLKKLLCCCCGREKDFEIKLDVGDEVRYCKNTSQVNLGLSPPKWSKGVHEVIAISGSKFLLDDGDLYKLSEIKKEWSKVGQLDIGVE